jgi:hypothetical protein
MANRILTILILSTIVLAGCGGEEQSKENAAKQITAANDAYKQALKKRGDVDPIEDRLAITREFLEEFPESEHTADAINAVFYYQGEELDDMLGAITYAEAIRCRIRSPEIAREVDKELLGFYGKSGMTERMFAIADQLAAGGALDFSDYWNVIEGAVKAKEWELVRDYCAKTRSVTNADVYKADYPDRDFSEEEISEAVNHRTGMLLVKDGWARANQGQIDEALADFAKADSLIPRYYFDIPEYDLSTYWGKTLLMKRDFEAATERFAMDGLVMGNEEAVTGLKEAYIGIHGSDTGYEAYAAELHLDIARTIDDFEMADYKGNRHRFSDLRSDMTVLTLWFPT